MACGATKSTSGIQNRNGGGEGRVEEAFQWEARHLSVTAVLIFTSADENSSCSITIHRVVFPNFMHQNALIYRIEEDSS